MLQEAGYRRDIKHIYVSIYSVMKDGYMQTKQLAVD